MVLNGSEIHLPEHPTYYQGEITGDGKNPTQLLNLWTLAFLSIKWGVGLGQHCPAEIQCKPQMWATYIILNFLVSLFERVQGKINFKNVLFNLTQLKHYFTCNQYFNIINDIFYIPFHTKCLKLTAHLNVHKPYFNSALTCWPPLSRGLGAWEPVPLR